MQISILVYLMAAAGLSAGTGLLFIEDQQIETICQMRWKNRITKAMSIDFSEIFGISPLVRRKKQHKIDLEIYEAISFMRNITAIGQENTTSTDGLIQQLITHKGILAPVYAHMLQLIRQNQTEEAAKYFAEEAGTEISGDFGRLLLQWEEINPKNLMETLLSHQKSLKEIRLTVQKKRDETMSDLIYMPVVINVMLVFVNFILVGYFLDQKELLNILL